MMRNLHRSGGRILPLLLLLCLCPQTLLVLVKGESPSRHIRESPSHRYSWMFGNWTACSKTCGEGYQLRAVTCMDQQNRQSVNHQFCSQYHMPVNKQRCITEPCLNLAHHSYQWVPGHWDKCSVDCGEGEHTQLMHCVETDSTGNSSFISDELCIRNLGSKPIYKKACVGDAESCPYWATGSWSECSVTCGHGSQTRRIYCQRDLLDQTSEPEILSDSHCKSETKPSQRKLCTLQLCADGSNSVAEHFVQTEESQEECATTRFGCCPDNITPAKGSNYSGCWNNNVYSEGNPFYLRYCTPDRSIGAEYKGT